MPYALINDCDIYYETEGAGQPLLFLHGGFGGLGTGGTPSDGLEWLGGGFSKSHLVISYDRRSAGRSASSEGLHTLDQFAKDSIGLMDHLQITSAIVWGESGGVAPAITLAMEFPQRVRALVLTDGAPWFTLSEELEDRLRARIEILEREGPEAAYEARRLEGTVGLQLFAQERLTTDPSESKRRDESRARIRSALAEAPREIRVQKYAAELRTYAAYLSFDVRETFRALAMPIFVLYGTSDTIFPGVDWRRTIDGMGNVEVKEVVDGEHGCGRTEEGVSSVRSFLSKLG